jgi:hypothetical protein
MRSHFQITGNFSLGTPLALVAVAHFSLVRPMTRAMLILLASCVTVASESRYTDAMYRKVVLDDSTSPLYVLFTLHDAKTGADRMLCTGGNFLLGAIHMEYSLDYDAAGMKRGYDIALRQPGHRFTFKSGKALKNIDSGYTPQMLAEARRLLAGLWRAQLRDSVDSGKIDELCHHGRDVGVWDAWQAAMAHVLLEHGILVGSADRTGLLFVER